jgi:hypothetical protein
MQTGYHHGCFSHARTISFTPPNRISKDHTRTAIILDCLLKQIQKIVQSANSKMMEKDASNDAWKSLFDEAFVDLAKSYQEMNSNKDEDTSPPKQSNPNRSSKKTSSENSDSESSESSKRSGIKTQKTSESNKDSNIKPPKEKTTSGNKVHFVDTNDNASTTSSNQTKGDTLNNDFATQAENAVPEPEPSDSSGDSSEGSLSDNSTNRKS